MKLFTKPELKDRANVEIGKLESELKLLRGSNSKKTVDNSERILELQKQYDALLSSYKKHKEEMMTEIANLQRQIQVKKEILYGIIERQDELDERERILLEKEVVIKDKEDYIATVLGGVVQS